MATKIFLNLAVQDLSKSVAFFTALGYSLNPTFTDDKAACIIISDTIYIMLLTVPFFQTFTSKEIVDARRAVECSIALTAESREAVDDLVNKAVSAGATIPDPPTDYGFMYQHSFDDLDGHHWEVFWMDPSGAPDKEVQSDK